MIALLAAAVLASNATPALAAEIHRFDIPEQAASAAIDDFASQAHVQILVAGEKVKDRTLRALSGEFSVEDGLKRLLADSGLKPEYVGDRSIALVSAGPAQTAGQSKSSRQDPPAEPSAPGAADRQGSGKQGQEKAGQDKRGEMDEEPEIVVTGTNIRGVQPTSPVVTITGEEMRLSGHHDLGEAMRALPQNFNGGQNPGVAPGASNVGGIANQNISGGSGINLRGLGPDATVTLLNGSRLPFDGFAQATDAAVIPTAAIERVEVLLDGASAIYGSDAVGGVANIILKRDYDGAELSGRYGVATDGGYEQKQATLVAGRSRDSGGFLISGDFSRNTPVRAGQRDYLSGMSYQGTEIYPQSEQKSVLVSGHQRFGGHAEFLLDGFYTGRRNELTIAISPTTGHFIPTESTIWGVSPSLDFTLPADWRLRLRGSAGRNDLDEVGRRNFDLATGVEAAPSSDRYRNEAAATGVEAEGPLFRLPGGEARVSVGGGWRRTSLEYSRSGAVVHAGDNTSRYGYGELSLPLLDELLLNTAVRYENYDTFGETTTPKIGVLWSPLPGLDLRASWGRSFKAPTLTQQYQAQLLYLYPASILGGAGAGAPADAQGIVYWGGDPGLKPETAETRSVGIVARPASLPGLRLEMNWFQIDYTDRVLPPIAAVGQALTNPAYAEFRTLTPGPADIGAAFDWAGLPDGTFSGNYAGAPYDPAKVFAILRAANTNAAADFLRGVDISARYRLDAWGGLLSLQAGGTWLTEAHRQLSRTSPEMTTVGVAFFPPRVRARFATNWSRGGFTLAGAVNYIGGVTDTIAVPNVGRGSMTTLDLVADCQVNAPLFGDIGIDLGLMNLFDQAPPFMRPVQAIYVSYDSLNYSPLGRVVSLSLSKRF